jgi:hypothetical protein
MDNEAMQRLTGTLDDAKTANRAVAVALHNLEETEATLDNLGGAEDADDIATRISRMVIATDYSTDGEGSDQSACDLEEMIAEALSVRFSKTVRTECRRNGGYTITATVRDDGADVVSIAASGATMWDAACSLAMATGYYTPADF